MIDQILGRPSPTLRRSQIWLILFFWVWRLYKGDGAPRPLGRNPASAFIPGSSRVSGGIGERVRDRAAKSWLWKLWVELLGRRLVTWMGKVNDRLRIFTPYQLILATLTVVYAVRHVDDLLGISAPEPLAKLYSRSYYRATYVNTALDAGFSMAMNIKPQWLKDISSMVFSGYYLLYAREGDEVLRRFRAVCSVEMLRTTWDKTNNPYIRLLTARHRPKLPIVRTIFIPRPSQSSRASLPPVKTMLFFSGSEAELAQATELIVDFPGGGFIAMSPECHEERLRTWARRTGKPVLGVNYGKAPEYPYPWSIEEGFDAYRTLIETKGNVIGIASGRLDIVLSGDSAGGNICATIMLRIIEYPTHIPRPISLVLAYPALDFNFTSWMSPQNLSVLRTEQSETQIPGMIHGKDHMRHKAPLSVVDDVEKKSRRQKTWAATISNKIPMMSPRTEGWRSNPQSPKSPSKRLADLPRSVSAKVMAWATADAEEDVRYSTEEEDEGDEGDEKTDSKVVGGADKRKDTEKSLADRVKTPREENRFELTRTESPAPMVEAEKDKEAFDAKVEKKRKKKGAIGTRLTMTSRVGYFQDRIISPTMMRAMAILYIGPQRNPDFETDYYISPILAPPHLLTHFPPVYLICGERDPFVDDTVIFSGKIRSAKRARKAEAETAALGKSTKHGEGLRMSTSKSKARREDTVDPILQETDEDWVQTRIIEGWGHGFMQMSSLMKEVDPVLLEMADWIDESFLREKERKREAEELSAAARLSASTYPTVEAGVTAHASTSLHLKPTQDYPRVPKKTGTADLGSAYFGAVEAPEDANDNLVTFTPKNKKRTPPPSGFLPVPRRASKESLASLRRSPSAPKFDADETGSSGEAMSIVTPPLSLKSLPFREGATRGKATFGLFGGTTTPAKPQERSGRVSPTLFGRPRERPGSSNASKPIPSPSAGARTSSVPPHSSLNSSTPTSPPEKPKGGLVAAALSSARAASPALAAAAGFVPQSVGHVSEAELMRRRRMEAVYGIGATASGASSEGEDE
ncbi:hormone-sensitive lipase [Cryptococcus wingfieldii CBS 7118]|uniref:Hormone-sensitive lipase n=1 Tax=Cryptococcus wingfieldii CBS 7118 TaxID=1295528 RepID=A0A1E3JRF1_9TREE|nr:hormone-sensitive lipase [Cryptococcus wingfieldii CBS 7118]ODO03459.1 hormone-sensitive lipase [Cryptococcus wingfieldii CBS 7118]